MKREPTKAKKRRLEEARLLHPQPETVQDPLFRQCPEFFDPHDLLQVRYEFLRAHLVGGESVVAVCKRYAVSRQTFYNLLAKMMQEGTPGLLPKKSGPKGPTKLTADVIDFVEEEIRREPELSGAVLASRIEEELSRTIHKRTLENLLHNLRSKKNA